MTFYIVVGIAYARGKYVGNYVSQLQEGIVETGHAPSLVYVDPAPARNIIALFVGLSYHGSRNRFSGLQGLVEI